MKTALYTLFLGGSALAFAAVCAFVILPLCNLGSEGYIVASSGCLTIAEVVAGVGCAWGAILAGKALRSDPLQRTGTGYIIFGLNAVITASFLFVISVGVYAMHT